MNDRTEYNPATGFVRDGVSCKLETFDAIRKLGEVADILHQRGQENGYDTGRERSAESVATIFNALKGKDLTETDVWDLLLILKLVRAQRADGPDSRLDMIGYAALGAECDHRTKNLAEFDRAADELLSQPTIQEQRNHTALEESIKASAKKEQLKAIWSGVNQVVAEDAAKESIMSDACAAMREAIDESTRESSAILSEGFFFRKSMGDTASELERNNKLVQHRSRVILEGIEGARAHLAKEAVSAINNGYGYFPPAKIHTAPETTRHFNGFVIKNGRVHINDQAENITFSVDEFCDTLKNGGNK